MTNAEEVLRRLREAKFYLEVAGSNLSQGYFPAASHYAQLCVELSAKAVIAYFFEPAWHHDPSPQLEEIIKDYGEQLPEQMRRDLERLASDAHKAAPWHGWSTYGKRIGDEWVSPLDLCTRKGAQELLQMAERSLKTAQAFAELVGLKADGT